MLQSKRISIQAGGYGGTSHKRGALQRIGLPLLVVLCAVLVVPAVTFGASQPCGASPQADEGPRDTADQPNGVQAAGLKTPYLTPDWAYLRTGSLVRREIDLELQVDGLRWTHSRTYDSQLFVQSEDQPTWMGNGWLAGNSEMILEKDGNDVAIVLDASSKLCFYDVNTSSNPVRSAGPDGSSFVLEHVTDRNEWVLTEHDFGRQIGVDISGNPATRIRVVVRPDGTVVTAFPF